MNTAQRFFPAPVAVPLADALNWQASPDLTFEEKKDGRRAELGNGELRGRVASYSLPGAVPPALAGCVLDGELVGNVFWCFDLIEANRQDMRDLPLRERKGRLLALQPHFPAWIQPVPAARPGVAGGDYLRQVLAAGAEGVVAKDLAASYGNGWRKAKRLATFDCVVTDTSGGKLSVQIGQYSFLHFFQVWNFRNKFVNSSFLQSNLSRVSIRDLGTLDSLRPGSVIEISAETRHASGKFRSPRFVRVRTDKPPTDCRIEKVEP